MTSKTATAKPKTTSVFAKPEFWTTFVTCVSGLLLAFGVITPEQSKGLETYVPNIIGAILSLLASFKFINVQHAAKVEVFRAMCATNLERLAAKAGKSDGATVSAASAASVEDPGDEVAAFAKAAGL